MEVGAIRISHLPRFGVVKDCMGQCLDKRSLLPGVGARCTCGA